MAARRLFGTRVHIPRHFLLAGVTVIAWSSDVAAQALDIDQPEIKAGERELRSVNIGNFSRRQGAAEAPRTSHELGGAYSPSDWFKGIVHLDVENLSAEGLIADHVGIETFTLLGKAPEDGGLALTWYTGLMISTDASSTNSLIFGPIIKLTQGKTSLTLNTYLEDTFGRNSGPGLNFLYGWQGRYEVSDKLAFGIEGFGKAENIGSSPDLDEQDHRLGPAVFFSLEAGNGRAYGLDLGVLVGLTDAAPDATLKVNFGSTF